MTTGTPTLAEFLERMLAEDEAAAALPVGVTLVQGSWHEPVASGLDTHRCDEGGPDYLVVDPARVLADVAAKRAIVAEHRPVDRSYFIDRPDHKPFWECSRCCVGDQWEGYYPEPWPCTTLRALAQPYAGREGWREEWTL